MELPFELGEYKERRERVLAAMARERLDVLLVFHQEHMYYLGGYDQIGYWVYQVLIVPGDGTDMTALVRRQDEPIVRDSPLIGDVRVWLDDDRVDPGTQTVEILRSRRLLAGKRIGVERKSHTLLPHFYALLMDALVGEEVVDASDLITEIRLIKSPRELAYTRRATAIMDEAFRVGLDLVAPGVRECDIHAAVVHAMYTAGGGVPAVPPPIASGPNVIWQTHMAASERQIQVREPFLLEVGAQYRRYHTVGIRMASLGPPARELQAMHAAAVESTDAGFTMVGPGVPSAQVARRVLAEIESRGFKRRGQQVGYGFGLGYPPTWLDNLRIKETDAHVLQPGMTFMLYGILVDSGVRLAAAIGDPVLVTESGAERLSTMPRELSIKE